jgi:hypothetical protein
MSNVEIGSRSLGSALPALSEAEWASRVLGLASRQHEFFRYPPVKENRRAGNKESGKQDAGTRNERSRTHPLVATADKQEMRALFVSLRAAMPC